MAEMTNDRFLDQLSADEENPKQEQRIEFESGNYCMLKDGLINVYLSSNQLLFSLDPDVIPFKRKPLGVCLQLYLMGHTGGRNNAKSELRAKLSAAFGLIFD